MKLVFLSLILIMSSNIVAQEYSNMCYYSAAGIAVGGMALFTAKQAYDTYDFFFVKGYNDEDTYEENIEYEKKVLLDVYFKEECSKEIKEKFIAYFGGETKEFPKFVNTYIGTEFETKYEIYYKIGQDGMRFVIYPSLVAMALGLTGFGLSYFKKIID